MTFAKMPMSSPRHVRKRWGSVQNNRLLGIHIFAVL